MSLHLHSPLHLIHNLLGFRPSTKNSMTFLDFSYLAFGLPICTDFLLSRIRSSTFLDFFLSCIWSPTQEDFLYTLVAQVRYAWVSSFQEFNDFLKFFLPYNRSSDLHRLPLVKNQVLDFLELFLSYIRSPTYEDFSLHTYCTSQISSFHLP